MKTLTDYLLEKRAPDESDFERQINNVSDRAFSNYSRIRVADDLLSSFLGKKDSGLDDSLKRMQLIRMSREMGVNPRDAMDDDFLEQDEGHPIRTLSRAKAAASIGVPAVTSLSHEARTLFGGLMRTRPLEELEAVGYTARTAPKSSGLLRSLLRSGG